jgi:hypothetical protein
LAYAIDTTTFRSEKADLETSYSGSAFKQSFDLVEVGPARIMFC